jgi:hypothetical protein
MIGLSLRERQRLANKTSHALAQRVVPAFLMRRLRRFFANRMRGTLGQDGLLRLPEVRIGTTPAIGGWDRIPQAPTRVRTVIPNDKGHNLAGATAQGRPQPLLVLARIDEGPHLIQFQNIAALFGRQRLRQCRQLLKVVFDPLQYRVAGNPQNAAYPAQTRPVSIRLQHLSALSAPRPDRPHSPCNGIGLDPLYSYRS